MIGDKKNHVLWRVPRRVDGLQFDVSYFKGVAVMERVVAWERLRPLALPVWPALCGEVEFDGRIGDCEFPRSADEIGVDVGLGDG